MSEYTLSACKAASSPCPAKAKVEVVAVGLLWLTHLIAGPPVSDVIEGVDIQIRYAGAIVETLTDSLSPTVGKSAWNSAPPPAPSKARTDPPP